MYAAHQMCGLDLGLGKFLQDQNLFKCNSRITVRFQEHALVIRNVKRRVSPSRCQGAAGSDKFAERAGCAP